MADHLARAAAQLLLDWLNRRFETSFAIAEERDETFVAADGAHRAGIAIATLWERDAAAGWEERLRALERRLGDANAGRAFLLWLPPRAGAPTDDDFIERVRAAAAPLQPGDRTEIALPATIRLAKTRDEGGYASVIGGLSRWWTRVTENVQGTYTVESNAVQRLTHDGEAREQLWQRIGEIARDVSTGQVAEFEIDQAWTLQCLDLPQPGFTVAGAPPDIDPTDGILVRRMARRRMQQAGEALRALDVDLRAVGLIGIYEFADVETAGATIKALAPNLYSGLESVSVLVDGEVRPVFLPRALPWAGG